MRILDMEGNPVENPNLDEGYLLPDKIFVAEHPAVPEVKEDYYYKTTYENEETGEREVEKVVITPYQAPQPAWTEYEDILRYHAYTPQEKYQHLLEQSMPTIDQRLADLEAAVATLINYSNGVSDRMQVYTDRVEQHQNTSDGIAKEYQTVVDDVEACKQAQTTCAADADRAAKSLEKAQPYFEQVTALAEAVAALQAKVEPHEETSPTTNTEPGPESEHVEDPQAGPVDEPDVKEADTDGE